MKQFYFQPYTGSSVMMFIATLHYFQAYGDLLIMLSLGNGGSCHGYILSLETAHRFTANTVDTLLKMGRYYNTTMRHYCSKIVSKLPVN